MLRPFTKRPYQGNNNQQANKKPLFTNTNSNSNIIFSNGSSLDWQKSREKLINKFKEEDCWSLVEREPNMVPEPNPLLNQILLTEVLFTDIKPSLDTIEEKLLAYDQECIDFHANNLALINAAGLNAADTARQVLSNNQDLAKKQFDRTQMRDNYVKMNLSELSLYQSNEKEYNRKRSNCIKVYTNYIGASALGIVKTHFEQNKFRRAWYELDKHYSADSGGRQTRTTVYNILNSLKFEGRNLTTHLKNFDDLVEQSVSLGHNIDDDIRFQLLFNSIKNGNNRDYDRTLEYCEYNNESYADFISRLQTKSSQLLLEGSVTTSVPQVSPVNNVNLGINKAIIAGRETLVNKRYRVICCQKGEFDLQLCVINLQCQLFVVRVKR